MIVVHKWMILFSFIHWSAQAFVWHSGENGKIQWANNCDYLDGDIGSERSRGEDCGRLCFRRPECTRFTWNYHNGGTCWLKAGNGNGKTEAVYAGHGGACGYVTEQKLIINGISWVMADSQRIRWAHSCDITGRDIEVRKSSGEMCGPACLSRRDCIGFVWTSFEGGTCWLKSRGYPIISDSGVGGICGEIIGRRSPPGVKPSDGFKSKAEEACADYSDIASNYRIRGTPAQRDEFPWMAALGYLKHYNGGTSEDNLRFLCGGTIISDYYILTAAHCTDYAKPVIARLGTHILDDLQRKTDLNVETCTEHPDFSFQAHKNDIALIKVRQRITFSTKILPACLRTDRSDLSQDKDLTVTGWGGTTDEGDLSNILKKASLKTVALQTCQADFLKQGSQAKDRINDSQYCARDPNHDQDACRGDSGAPIQIFDNPPLATVVGVVSFGKGCPSELPGIYSRVAHYLGWIEEIVWRN